MLKASRPTKKKVPKHTKHTTWTLMKRRILSLRKAANAVSTMSRRLKVQCSALWDTWVEDRAGTRVQCATAQLCVSALGGYFDRLHELKLMSRRSWRKTIRSRSYSVDALEGVIIIIINSSPLSLFGYVVLLRYTCRVNKSLIGDKYFPRLGPFWVFWFISAFHDCWHPWSPMNTCLLEDSSGHSMAMYSAVPSPPAHLHVVLSMSGTGHSYKDFLTPI